MSAAVAQAQAPPANAPQRVPINGFIIGKGDKIYLDRPVVRPLRPYVIVDTVDSNETEWIHADNENDDPGSGSLFQEPFERIYNSRAARWWRDKRFVPPMCAECPDIDVCAGACPLYWDAAGGFDELPRVGSGDRGSRRRWERRRRRGKSFGVPAPTGLGG